jgi:hypothetical protein
MAAISYKTTCYTGVDAFKAVYDVTRDDVPYQYCTGKNGFDANLTLDEVITKIAKPKEANFIVKTGPKAKWYVKKVSPTEAHETLKKGDKYCTVKNPTAKCYVVEW